MLRFILFEIVLVILSANGEEELDLRKVHLEGLGNVIGIKYWDGEYYEFFGIPYATVPKGRDRYKPPLPVKPWKEDMKANRNSVLCKQVHKAQSEDEEDLLAGDEECLVANIIVPKIANETKLVPVIFYIHSGAYVGGNGNMAKYHSLPRQDVMVVNINYRLGAFGFACLGTEDIPGNAGLKDIVAALKFIKKHAKSFGGDPDNITLAGFSIGASLAELVALSPVSRGLFDKLALDSGSALNPFAVNRNPIETAKNIAISVGYEDTGNIEDLNEFFLDADPEDILGASIHFHLKNSTFGFTPCIENPNNPDAVLVESPLDTLKKGKYGDFALLAGYANMEGISRTIMFNAWWPRMHENFADFLPADLVFDDDKERDEFIKEVKQYYFGSKPINIDSVQGYIDYFSDAMFKYAIVKSLNLHAQNLKRSIFAYEFSYVGKLSTQHNYMNRIRGASHRDASAYLLDFYDWTRNHTDMDRRDLMNFMWADFMRFENPTAYESPLITIKWLKYTDTDKYYLDLGDRLVMKKNPFSKGYQFWDKVYNKHYWNPTVVNPNSYQKPKDTKPKPIEKKTSSETKPVENKPTVDTKPAENKPVVESKPVDDKLKESADKVTPEHSKNTGKADAKPAAVKTNAEDKDTKSTKTEEQSNVKSPKTTDEKPQIKVEDPIAKAKSSSKEEAKK